MFTPHPNLADEVNGSIIQSEIEGGVFLSDLPPSTVLEIQTMHHRYTAVLLGGSEALISGHPEFCPDPGDPGPGPAPADGTRASPPRCPLIRHRVFKVSLILCGSTLWQPSPVQVRNPDAPL